jgi:inosine-uridine nucleoside N-ribohydrolase
VRKTILISVIALGMVAGCAGGSTVSETTTATPPTESAETSIASTTTVFEPERTPLIIDTDVSIEGIMSILYLLEQEQYEILALTVSGTGIAHCEAGLRQVAGILEMYSAGEVPFSCGSEVPIEGHNAFPSSWRAGADEGYGLQFPEGAEPSDLTASELIVAAINESPARVVMYADAPQTNLAEALRIDPNIASNIEMAYLMGGAFDVPGNAMQNPDAEWNTWIDPVAVDEVFRSGIPITLVPLDATNQVPLHIFHLEALEGHETSAAQMVVTMLTQSKELTDGTLFLWDQATAALAVDDSLATYENVNIEVLLDEDRSIAGTTVIADGGTEMRVATAIDVERFETEFLSTLAGEDIGPITIESDIYGTYDGSQWSFTAPESLRQGEYVLHMINESDAEIVVAFGWLLGDATLEQLDAGEGTAKPDFYELDFFLYGVPHSSIVAKIKLANNETYAIVGLDNLVNEGTTLGLIEVIAG